MTDSRAAAIGLLVLLGSLSQAETLPPEPLEIGTAPQFLFDRYVVDNHWAIKYGKETVQLLVVEPMPVVESDCPDRVPVPAFASLQAAPMLRGTCSRRMSPDPNHRWWTSKKQRSRSSVSPRRYQRAVRPNLGPLPPTARPRGSISAWSIHSERRALSPTVSGYYPPGAMTSISTVASSDSSAPSLAL